VKQTSECSHLSGIHEESHFDVSSSLPEYLHPMAIRVVRLGTPRLPGEGLRLGTVRRPPRGVRKDDFARRDYYDLWLPELSASAPLVSWALAEPWTDRRWTRYARSYRGEMKAPAAQHLIALLAALSRTTDFSVGCYCDDENRCHRSLLRDLLVEAGAEVV
jgi:uncharacterized protein YeaO (DUF488 family)